MEWYEKLVQIAREIHSKYCNSICFTRDDVLNLAVLHLTGAALATQRGTSEITIFGEFGNVSYDHLIDSFYKAVQKLRQEAEEAASSLWGDC